MSKDSVSQGFQIGNLLGISPVEGEVDFHKIIYESWYLSFKGIITGHGLNAEDELMKGVIHRRAEEQTVKSLARLAETSINQKFLSFFEIEPKRDLEKFLKTENLSLTQKEITGLAFQSKTLIGYSHKMFKREYLPKDLSFKPSDVPKMASGEGKVFKKFTKGVRLIFRKRKILIFHLFEKIDDDSKWFCIYYNMLEELERDKEKNHYKDGSHVHFTNHLYSTKEYMLEAINKEKNNVKHLHINFIFPDEEEETEG